MCRLALLSVLCAPSLVVSLSFNGKEMEAAETEDKNFLATQWRALESEMMMLQKNLATEEAPSSGFLQVHANPVAKAETTKEKPKKKADANAGKMEPKDLSKPKAASEQKKLAAKTEQSKASAAPPAMDRLAQTQAMMKGLEGQAMLAPMLGMLKSMYDDQKKRIGDLNKREQKSKERFAKQQSDFDAKIKDIKMRHDKHKLSDEFFKNETRDYTRQFKYWQGVRERNHRQFHNALKITHGMMQREKDMISKYEAAMSMKMPAKDTKKPAAPVEAPEVVFVQQQKAAAAFIQEALVEVRRNLAETLDTADHPPLS